MLSRRRSVPFLRFGFIMASLLLVSACSNDADGDVATDSQGSPQNSDVPSALSEVDRQVLNESVAPGHGDKVAAAGEDPEVCAVLGGAVEASKKLDAASGEDLLALLGPSKEPMDQAATVLAAKGFELTAAHYGRYRDALIETEADIDLSDQASRDRANERFVIVKAKGAGTTETELGGLATVCGVS